MQEQAMKIRPNATPVCLADDQILSLTEARGWTVECRRGRLWITQDGDPRDIFIGAGERFTFDRDTPVLVSALGESTVAWRPVPAPQRFAEWLQAVARRMAPRRARWSTAL
jgi:hypothetical protein